MPVFPQRGACLCGEIEYRLLEDALTVYACHCTECQRQGGASFSLGMIVRRAAFELVRGEASEYRFETSDGRVKQASFCPRCSTRLWNPAQNPDLLVLEAGTLDDASWVYPVGHIWTRSAQPWLSIPEGAMRFAEQPPQDDWMALVRAWRGRAAGAARAT